MKFKKYELYMREVGKYEEFAISDCNDVYVFATESLRMHERDREVFSVIAVDAKGAVIGVTDCSIGDLNSTIVQPREIAKFLILSNTAGCICLHNHPSGDLTASDCDINTTRRLNKALEMLGIKLIDHLIISNRGFYSMRSGGYI